MIVIASYFSLIYPFYLANYIDLSSMGEVLCDGFNLAVLYIPVTEGDKTHICIVAIMGKRQGLFILIGFTLCTHVFLKASLHFS